MKKVKALLSAATAAVLALSLFGCAVKDAGNDPAQSSDPAVQGIEMSVAALKGPTGIGMVKLMQDSDAGTTTNKYSFQVFDSPDNVVAAVSNVDNPVQVAAVPVNVAASLYNKTNGKIQVAAINTLGTLFLLENGDSIQSVADLKGKTIYVSGQGATPEYVLDYILTSNGIDPDKDVDIQFVADHATLATMMVAGEADIALLPQPNVTTVLTQAQDVRIALDLTKVWDDTNKVNGKEGQLSMGCIIVNKEFAEQNKAAFNKFLDEYKTSVEYVTNETNLDAAAQLCETYGIIPKAAVAKKAIPDCNITYIEGAEMKQNMQQNLQILFDANPKSIGGTMPDDAFYYTR
ncbi:MAG TPA: ABC transporter substrate-binding protein [Candidatus Onthovicinus excrementipullorum]|nr:ABC transporter substrate-binding protein [Candidatus Onthovicinus excrementipullorum]